MHGSYGAIIEKLDTPDKSFVIWKTSEERLTTRGLLDQSERVVPGSHGN